ncbi:hypothetical protein ACLOJK_013289 [Asimina triloba]
MGDLSANLGLPKEGCEPHDALLEMHREKVGQFASCEQWRNKWPQVDLEPVILPSKA